MSKYTVEAKLQAVERYLTGNESYQTIAESIGAAKSQVIKALICRHFVIGYTFYKRCTYYINW